MKQLMLYSGEKLIINTNSEWTHFAEMVLRCGTYAIYENSDPQPFALDSVKMSGWVAGTSY